MQLSTSLHLLEYANYAIRHHLPCKKVPELKDRGSSCMINNSIYQDTHDNANSIYQDIYGRSRDVNVLLSIYQDTHDNAKAKS